MISRLIGRARVSRHFYVQSRAVPLGLFGTILAVLVGMLGSRSRSTKRSRSSW